MTTSADEDRSIVEALARVECALLADEAADQSDVELLARVGLQHPEHWVPRHLAHTLWRALADGRHFKIKKPGGRDPLSDKRKLGMLAYFILMQKEWGADGAATDAAAFFHLSDKRQIYQRIQPYRRADGTLIGEDYPEEILRGWITAGSRATG